MRITVGYGDPARGRVRKLLRLGKNAGVVCRSGIRSFTIFSISRSAFDRRDLAKRHTGKMESRARIPGP